MLAYIKKIKKLLKEKKYKKLLNSLLKNTMNYFVQIKYFFEKLLVIPLKIDKKKIVFCNFYGNGYGDSPKYIAEYIIKKNLDYKLVWLVKKEIVEKFPKEIEIVKYGSLRSMYELATAKIWIDNTRKKICPYKKKKQYYIQTWHSPLRLKKIEADAIDELPIQYIKSAKRDSKNIDLILSGCDFSYNIYKNSFWYNGEIIRSGTPRCDILFNINEHFNIKKQICSKYNVDITKKIILYAPTFRNNFNIVQEFNFNKFSKLININDEYQILLKLHPADKNDYKFGNSVIDVSSYPDIQELICISDCLITDYSSCCFDMLIANKLCTLYVPDLEQYMKQERKLYFNINELPFPVAKNIEELANIIVKGETLNYYNNIKKFKEKVRNVRKW